MKKAEVLNNLVQKQVGEFFSKNDILKAGIGFFLFTSGINLLHKTVTFIWQKIKYRFIISLEISYKDESFQWILEWLSEITSTQTSTELELHTCYDEEHGGQSGNPRPKVMFTLSSGYHHLLYKGKHIWLKREQDTSITDPIHGGYPEKITITLLGQDRKYLQDLVDDAMELNFAKQEGKTVIYVPSCDWKKFGNPRIPRPLNSVILPKDIKETILRDIKDFLSRADWYRNMGIPYRRGYLFYGYPGTGKTSFIFSIAGELGMNICIMNLSDKNLDDRQLNYLLNESPPRSIILLEDIDAAFLERGNSDSSAQITFSGILNALDGIGAQEGRILFMTTNRIELLDSALIRPGRVDVSIHFDLADSNQVKEMFLRFYPNLLSSSPVVEQFLSQVPEKTRTMAEIQGFLLKYIDNPIVASNQISNYISSLPPHRKIQNTSP